MRTSLRALKIFLSMSLLCVLTLVSACQQKENAETSKNIVRVGTIEGPETQLMEVAQKVAWKNKGLKIEIVTFNDYDLPNAALSDGSIDANMFQHQPYLDASNLAHHYELISVGKTFIYPMGIYSKKIKKLSELPQNASVAIPSDPTNEARALLLLQKANLITLKNSDPLKASPLDIEQNPRNLQIKELNAAQLPRILDDVEIAVINTNYAIPAGLLPHRDALFIEANDSPYANLVVVRRDEKDDLRFRYLLDALRSKEVIAKAEELFKGQAIPAWKK